MATEHEIPHGLPAPSRPFSRRSLIGRGLALGLGGGAALTLLDACGTGAAGGVVDITYWNLFGGGDGVRMVQMQDAFTQSHPDINLKAVTLSWGQPYYTKVAMSAAGGRSPDVAISHLSRVSTYAQIGFLDPFDLSELAKVGITESNFLPEIWQRGHYNDKLYAVPLDTHPYVMYYNTDICKKAGLLDAKGNLSLVGPSALIDAFKKTKAITGYTALTVNSFWRLFSSLYGQLGGKILSPDAKQLVIDDDKALQALDFITEITVKNQLCLPTVDSVAYFGSSKAAFHWNGEWEVTTFITQKTPFSMVLFPNVFGNNDAEADSHSFILPHQDNPDPASRYAAYQFVAGMLQQSLTWAQGGHIPAYQPVATSSEYKQLKPQSNYAGAAPFAVYDPSAWFSGSGSQLEAQGDAAFLAVASGQLTPQQGLQQFKAGIQKLIDTPSPL